MSVLDNVEEMKWLIEKGVDINKGLSDAGDSDTYLHLVRTSEVAKLLIEHGANVNAKNNDGMTPLHAALDHEDGRAYNDAFEIAKILLEAGAKVDETDQKGWSPILHARNIEMVKLLTKHGADIDAKYEDGSTLLHEYSSSFDGIGFTNELIDHGANVDARDDLGRTPLHHIVSKWDFCEEEVCCLLNAGADPRIKDNDGDKPSDYAKTKGNPEIAEILMSKEHELDLREKHQVPANKPRGREPSL